MSTSAEDRARALSKIRIEAAVAASPLFDGPVGIAPVRGGFTNLNWLITSADGTIIFAKDPGEEGPAFIDRDVAREAALRAGETGYAPRMLGIDPASGVEFHEYLGGYVSATVADMADRGLRAQVMRGYKLVHDTAPFSVTKTGLDQIEEHLNQIHSQGLALPPSYRGVAPYIEAASAAIRASGIDLRPCYNDGHVTNYMLGPSGDVRIIDWEYAANNDRYWDVALFGLEIFLDRDELYGLLEDYEGSAHPTALARIEAYAVLTAAKWGLWAAIQSQTSPLAFDFRKYGETLFERIRRRAADPVWAETLRRV